MKSGLTIVEMAQQIERQSKLKQDYLLDTRRLQVEPFGSQLYLHTFDDHDDPLVEPLEINQIAHRQIGTHLKIPAAYYDRMLSDYPELLAENVNSWFQREPTQRMVRTLDGTVRAFLSNRYRRIDNLDIAEIVLPVIQQMEDAYFESCQITDSRMYIKVVNKRLEAEVVPGDIVQSGVIISNSEVGLGSVNIQPLVYRLVCSNGMVVNDAQTRRTHIGRVNEADENFQLFSQETLAADDHAFAMKIKDNMPLPQIHRSDILAFYTKLLKHGFAINSLESINTIVHPTLEMAVDDDYIRKNPSKGIYRKLKTDGSAPKPKRRIALTKTQQQNFLRFIAKSPTYSHWLPIMTVLLGTGMRVAECTGITKSDINLSENTISVNHNLIYRVIDGKAGFHITTPKTESGTRIIPILYPEVAEQLRLQIETIDALYPDDQLVLGGVHGFVFRNRTGSFMSAHNINRAIERISVTYNMEEMDQAELEDREPDLLPHFSVHNLRHTFCTRLCESTNDVKFIQQVMGHADFSTTMDIYTHITQENMQEKAKNISVNMKLM